MELIEAVRRRYSHVTAAGRMFTLVHREPPRRPEPDRRPGILGAFRPHLLSMGRSVRDEVSALLTKRIEARDKVHGESMRALEKRMELTLAKTEAGLRALRRDADTAERREAERKRELERLPAEARPVSARDARKMLEGRLEETGEALREEIGLSARKSVSEALRRAREREEYERMRRPGGGRL